MNIGQPTGGTVLSGSCCVWSPGLLCVVCISSLCQPAQMFDHAAWFSHCWEAPLRGSVGAVLISPQLWLLGSFVVLCWGLRGPSRSSHKQGDKSVFQALYDASLALLNTTFYFFCFIAFLTPQFLSLAQGLLEQREERKNTKSRKEQVLCQKSPLKSRLSYPILYAEASTMASVLYCLSVCLSVYLLLFWKISNLWDSYNNNIEENSHIPCIQIHQF